MKTPLEWIDHAQKHLSSDYTWEKCIEEVQKDAFEAGRTAGLEEAVAIVTTDFDKSPLTE